MIEITETPTGIRVTRGQLVIEIEDAAIATALGPLIAEMAMGIPWDARQIPEVPRVSDAEFVSAWNAAARLAGSHIA